MENTENFYHKMLELNYTEQYARGAKRAAERFLMHMEGKKITLESIEKYSDRRFYRQERRLLFLFFCFINGKEMSPTIWQPGIKTTGHIKIRNKQEVLQRFTPHQPAKISGRIYCNVLRQNIPVCQVDSCDRFPCIRNV